MRHDRAISDLGKKGNGGRRGSAPAGAAARIAIGGMGASAPISLLIRIFHGKIPVTYHRDDGAAAFCRIRRFVITVKKKDQRVPATNANMFQSLQFMLC